MKTLNNIKSAFLKAFFLIAGLILTGTLSAQDAKDVNVDVNMDAEGGGGIMANWWMWLIGLAIFVIIIVAIVSASRRRD